MDLAAAQGVSVEELGNALLARSGVRPQEKVPILFVECTGRSWICSRTSSRSSSLSRSRGFCSLIWVQAI